MPKRTTPWFSSAAPLLAFLVMQPPAPARATTFEELDAMVLAKSGAEELADDLVIVAAKVLRDAGKDGDAETLIDDFSEYSERSVNDVVCRANGDCDPRRRFFRHAIFGTYKDVIHAFPDAAARDLEVELTFMIRVREERNITLPRAFVEIAKAGEMHATAEFARYEAGKREYDPASGAILDALAGLVPGGRPTEPDRARVLAAEAKYSIDPVDENAIRMPIAEITTRWAGNRVIATGTVSRVETMNGNTNLHFQPAGNQVIVCFPEDVFRGSFGMKDFAELIGKTVEVRGSVTLPEACTGVGTPYGVVVPGAMELGAPSQMKLLGSAAGAPAANAINPASPARPGISSSQR
jgi:hypothetical protein